MTVAGDFQILQRQFRALTGLELTARRTNAPGLRLERLDSLLTQLSDLLFCKPDLGEPLWRFALQWLDRCNCETTRALAAYVAYCREDYGKAVNYLLSAVASNPQNLDNWLDLGFALNHAGDSLGRDILFDHDCFLEGFAETGSPVCTLAMLRGLGKRIREEGRDYGAVWRQFVPEPVRRRNRGERPSPAGEERTPPSNVTKM